MSKCMGWHVLSSSNHLGCGPVDPLGCGTGCLLSAPTGDRVIAVRCGHGEDAEDRVSSATSVWVGSQRGMANGDSGSVLYQEGKWQGVPGEIWWILFRFSDKDLIYESHFRFLPACSCFRVGRSEPAGKG